MEIQGCKFQFKMNGKPRNYCNLDVSENGYCIFHSTSVKGSNYKETLKKEVERTDHWLEGVQITEDLTNINLTGAKMPRANFEGISIKGVLLDYANLEAAIFRSAVLSEVSFYSSNLQGAIFDRAKSNGEFSLDLRCSDIGGTSFIGSKFKTFKLQDVIISKPFRTTYLLNSSIFEEKNGDWESAAYIYSTIAERSRKDWNNQAEDEAIFRAMTCRHRRRIKANPIVPNSYIRNWIIPSIRAGATGLFWYLHREIWGYGSKPLRLFTIMVLTIVGFATLFAITDGVVSKNYQGLLSNSIFFSIQSFLSMTYGNILPKSKFSEALGTLEAFIGLSLFSLFIVSLSAKLIRRI
jgi:uncharacterized protein YjbI with pentapeptide repeats